MKLTARLALSQLKVNKRRTTWTAVGIVLSTAMITTVYGLGFGSGIDMVDRLIGDAPFRAIYENTINGIAFLMSIIILTISVIVISNAFRVSAAERSRQFGILKSTGATKKQITATVVYEGIFLTVFAIPLGIVLGIFTQFLGVLLLEHFLFPLIENDPTFPYDYLVKFVFSTRAIWMSLLISASTVFISAWLPARKAAKIPAIDAIKGVGEVKIKNKKVRTSGLILKVFKLEGLLAAKFLKRSSRNFRATVVAMSFSIIIFIVAGGFLGQMERLSSLMWQDTDVNVRLSLWPDMTRSYLVDCEEEHHWSHEILDVEGNYIRTECFVSVRLDIDLRLDDMNEITERVRAELGKNDTLFVRGDVRATTPEQVRIDLRTLIDVSDWTPQMVEVMDEWYPMMRDGMADMGVQLVIIDEVSHRYFAELAGVGLEENILINASRYHFIDGRRIEFEPFRIIPQTLELPGFDWESGEEELSTVLEIHGALGVAQVPLELLNWSVGSLQILVPESFTETNEYFEISRYEWFITTEESARIAAYGDEILLDFVGDELGFMVHDFDAAEAMDRGMIQLISTLTYAFVGVLILIGLTNVISTISENIKTRSNEFAMLQSAGMTSKGIRRMLNLESIFSSVRSLMFGVPLGIFGTVMTHRNINSTAGFSYTLPWIPIIISVVAVFLTTWVTMQHAARKLRNQNIIETIRSGSGM